MTLCKRLSITLIAVVFLSGGAKAQETIDHVMVDKFRDEGLNRSQVMETASYMVDVFGPRLSNSPAYNRAAQWAKKRFEDYGISVEVQSFGEVGLGWENKYTSVHMHKPEYQPVIAYPVPWTRGTNGKIVSDVVFVNTREIYSESDLDRYKSQLVNTIVFTMPKRKLELQFNPVAVRISEEELEGMAELKIIPEEESVTLAQSDYAKLREGDGKQPLPNNVSHSFFEEEGAAVLVQPGLGGRIGHFDKGVVSVAEGSPIGKNDPKPFPRIIMAAEHYNRVVRILEKGIDVEMEVNIKIEYDEEDLDDYNVIAEIPGTDLRDEVVMIGGHYDAESAGTGATDNASGSAAVMEAMRILKATGAQPRRTIRATLWGSEEAGLRGSRAYVAQNFGGPDRESRKPDLDKLSVYFNMDWYGRFRGIFLQGNDLVRPIFEAWIIAVPRCRYVLSCSRKYRGLGPSFIRTGRDSGISIHSGTPRILYHESSYKYGCL